MKDFAFVWVLFTLLLLYIVSIEGERYTLFAVGNVIVETIILIYLLKTRNKKNARMGQVKIGIRLLPTTTTNGVNP